MSFLLGNKLTGYIAAFSRDNKPIIVTCKTLALPFYKTRLCKIMVGGGLIGAWALWTNRFPSFFNK